MLIHNQIHNIIPALPFLASDKDANAWGKKRLIEPKFACQNIQVGFVAKNII